MSESNRWRKVLEPDELPEGRVKSVTCGRRTFCLTHYEGEYAALDNRCPHQGGPLGEGTIENGLLRCPWHGWDYDPLTGESPGEFDDTVPSWPVEVRDDGIYVELTAEDIEPVHQRTVADAMVETMVNWGVKHVWGMVGHSNLGLGDALRRQAVGGKLNYYGIRHEGAASFAASAYGKLTGRPAACFAIAGPGATNLLTGLWDANVDRSPTLALTGQVASQVLGTGNFQEVDLKAAFGQVAQFGHTVLHESRHAELMTLACKSAILNRGVSHLIFPDEVQNLPGDGLEPGGPQGRLTPRDITPPASQVDDAVQALRSAKRPVIVVGHGARFHMKDVLSLAEELSCPVLTTFKAKGQIGDHHPLGCGVLGRSGTPIASYFMNESDLLVVFGASFSKHTGIAPKVPTIQVDFDPMVLGKFHSVEHLVYGEIGITSRLLRAQVAGEHSSTDVRAEIAHRWSMWRSEKATRRGKETGDGLSSAVIFEALTRTCPEDAIIAVDVGNNTYSFGRYFECTAHSVLMSGYLGSIGFGLPAAMGAWAATTEDGTPWFGRKVISVSGDGGLGQYLADFTTLVKYDMDVTHVVLNNAELGKISKEQRSAEWKVWETSLVNPNFSEFARNCGGHGARVTDPSALEIELARAIEIDGPALVEIMADPMLI